MNKCHIISLRETEREGEIENIFKLVLFVNEKWDFFEIKKGKMEKSIIDKEEKQKNKCETAKKLKQRRVIRSVASVGVFFFWEQQ